LRAGVLSALGLLVAPPAYDMVKTYKAPIRTLNAGDITAQMDMMESEISTLLNDIEEAGERRFRRALDVGYIGQSYQVTVPLEGAPEGEKVFDTFARLYRKKYGYFYEDVPAEIVNLRVLGEIAGAGLDLTPMEAGDGSAAVPTGERLAYSPSREEMIPFAVYGREMLHPGMSFNGPAIIEEVTSTTIVDNDGSVEIDAYGSLVVTLEGV
jgi:N-methylhydantoinase A